MNLASLLELPSHYFLFHLLLLFFSCLVFPTNQVFFIIWFLPSNSFLVLHSFNIPWVIWRSRVKAWGILQDPAILAGIEWFLSSWHLTPEVSAYLFRLPYAATWFPSLSSCTINFRNSDCPKGKVDTYCWVPFPAVSFSSGSWPSIPPCLW